LRKLCPATCGEKLSGSEEGRTRLHGSAGIRVCTRDASDPVGNRTFRINLSTEVWRINFHFQSNRRAIRQVSLTKNLPLADNRRPMACCRVQVATDLTGSLVRVDHRNVCVEAEPKTLHGPCQTHAGPWRQRPAAYANHDSPKCCTNKRESPQRIGRRKRATTGGLGISPFVRITSTPAAESVRILSRAPAVGSSAT